MAVDVNLAYSQANQLRNYVSQLDTYKSLKDNKFSTKYAVSVTELASLRVLTESTGGFYSI